MSNEAGTAAENAAPGEDKFEKATSAMKEMLNPSKEQETSEDGTPGKEGEETEETESTDDTEGQGESSKGSDWETRYKHVQSYADKASANAEKLALTMVAKDPESIHSIAKLDTDLANRIVAKELKQEYGISTYEEFVELINKKAGASTAKDVPEEVDKRISALEEALEKKEVAEAEAYVATFKTAHPEFTGKIEDKVWEVFDKGNFTLEEAFDYVMYKESRGESESKAEEKAFRKVANQKAASGIASPSVRTDSGNTKSKVVDKATRDFLEAIGAKKTLSKLT